MNKKEVLSQANLLVSNGLRKAAIDLLREYISFDPNCPTVLSTLGRAYRLDKQTDRAIHYLKKSLEVKNLAKQAENKQSSYHVTTHPYQRRAVPKRPFEWRPADCIPDLPWSAGKGLGKNRLPQFCNRIDCDKP